jgi:hypothetical protein
VEHFDENRILGLARVLDAFANQCDEIARATRTRSGFEHAQEARTTFLMLRGNGIGDCPEFG